MLNKFKLHAKNLSYESLLALVGKRLGCVCKPKKCHGDILIEEMISRAIIFEL